MFDAVIIWYFNDFTLLVKDEAKVILDGSEPLVGKLDSTIGEEEDSSFLEDWLEFVTGIFEERCLNLGGMLVHQVNTK